MATTAKRLLTVDEFLQLEFSGDEGRRVELDNGRICMMAGGSGEHARVQKNIFGALFIALRGTGCAPYGPDMGIRTHDLSLRYPDVSVFCGRDAEANDKLLEWDDPRVVVEVLSPSTKDQDERVKLHEYCAVASLDAILYADPVAKKLRLLTRTGARGWSDIEIATGATATLPTLNIVLTWEDVFGRV